MRIGLEFRSLLRAFWRTEMFGDFDKRRAKTVIPVPPGTALHQLYSVAPAGRVWRLDGGVKVVFGCSAMRKMKEL